jgi:hypothetical protein
MLKPHMTHLRLAILALSLFAIAAFAQPSEIVVYPPGPTNETPITLGIITSCPRGDIYRVQKSANEVLLIIKAVGTCPSPPIPNLDQYVPIGTLPAGTYRVSYIFEGGDDIVRPIGTIHVRNARSPVPFEIHPFTVRTNPAGLRLRINPLDFGHFCPLGNCSGTTIRVGGIIATDLRGEADGSVSFLAPAHAEGLVDVVVEAAGNTWTYPAAVYYFDSPDLFAFERILFPVLFDAPGANGSDWRSEAVVSNPNPWFIENYNSIDSIVCVTFPCGERLSPGGYAHISGGRFPRGVALLVPRPEADGVDFALRVRDVSRQAEGFGTEVPVVRERNLLTDRPIALLEVPLDPRYRVKVRIYAFDPVLFDNRATVTVMVPETRAVKSEQRVMLTRGCPAAVCPFTPLYAELDLPPGAEGERVTVSITAPQGAPSWAFATVTNNNTQQVTVVSPQ